MSRPKGRADWQATYVRLPRALHTAVKAQAEAEDRTMAQLVRRALKQYIAPAPVAPDTEEQQQ